jgi:hypothetical protein
MTGTPILNAAIHGRPTGATGATGATSLPIAPTTSLSD